MLDELENWPGADAVLERATALIDLDFRALVREERYLASTLGAQLATVVAGIASATALNAAGVTPDFLAGQSVGVYAAAVVANALTLETALGLVRERATRMMDAFPAGYGLAAIVGLSERRIGELVRTNIDGSLSVANHNAPGQYVLAGSNAALEATLVRARESGAVRATMLDVPVPSHGPLLDCVAAGLKPSINAAAIANPRITMIGASTARSLTDAHDVREEFLRELRVPQRWHDATEALHERGATLFVQCAPGDALADLAAAAFPDARAVALAKTGVEGIAQLVGR